ncbi:exported hypothetical protein [metagenome]|uniref:Uncharacterized protein n=1 Tax=metagenome TaxID=256318 RepID=A0A2P2C8A2_9ZZZZ
MYEHKRPLFAFVLVAVICAIVVGTTMKSQAIFGVMVPWAQPVESSPSGSSLTSAAPEPYKTPPVVLTVRPAKAPRVVVKADDAVASAPHKVHRKHQQTVHYHPPVHQSAPDGGRHPGHHHSQPPTPEESPDTDPTRGLTVLEAITGPVQLGPVEPGPVEPSPVEPSPVEPSPTPPPGEPSPTSSPVVPEGGE